MILTKCAGCDKQTKRITKLNNKKYCDNCYQEIIALRQMRMEV